MIIIYLIVGVLLGGLIIYLLLRPRLKATQTLNLDIQNQNENLHKENELLYQNYLNCLQDISKCSKTKANLNSEI